MRATAAAAARRVGNYWHMLPQAEQARKAIWDAINPHSGKRRIDEAFPQELRKRTRNNEMMIELQNGSIWQVVGSDNYNALVGSPPLGVVFSEFSLADPSAWAYLRPILRENGGWAVFIYTPRGRNHGYALYQSAKAAAGWFHEVKDATQTGVFSPAELEEERLEYLNQFGQELGQAFFDQEYMCSFDAAVLGAVYASAIRTLESRGDIRPLAHDPSFPVSTAWDFGFSDATAIWFYQLVPDAGGTKINVIDHYENTGQDAQHFAEAVLGHKLIALPDGKYKAGEPIDAHAHRQFYRYEWHNGPHDGLQKTLAAGGRSLGDQFHNMGVPMRIIPATSQVNQIAAARKTLESCRFDMTRCKRGLDALSNYHFPWDDKKRTLGEHPVHDWSSHSSDAFEILGQVWQQPREQKPAEKPRYLHEATADEVFWPKHSGVNKWQKQNERV